MLRLSYNARLSGTLPSFHPNASADASANASADASANASANASADASANANASSSPGVGGGGAASLPRLLRALQLSATLLSGTLPPSLGAAPLEGLHAARRAASPAPRLPPVPTALDAPSHPSRVRS